MLGLAFQERHGLDFELLCPGNLSSVQLSSALQSCPRSLLVILEQVSPPYFVAIYIFRKSYKVGDDILT